MSIAVTEANVAQLWDKWRDSRGIPEALLEMYRRYSERDSGTCETCDHFLGGTPEPDECDDYDARCELIDCVSCPLHGDGVEPAYCELYRPHQSSYKSKVAWKPEWRACGAYEGEA